MEGCLEPGTPDWYYRMRGAAGWVEAKLIPATGRCPEHFTLEQLMWGEDEVKYGGRWNLLGLREGRARQPREWVVFDAAGARDWFEGAALADTAIYREVGPFPTRDIAFLLVPRRAMI